MLDSDTNLVLEPGPEPKSIPVPTPDPLRQKVRDPAVHLVNFVINSFDNTERITNFFSNSRMLKNI
jgi:hypothetical protein